jgi:hypothetical protein
MVSEDTLMCGRERSATGTVASTGRKTQKVKKRDGTRAKKSKLY